MRLMEAMRIHASEEAMVALPVLGEATASIEPGDGALDHPWAGRDDEAMGVGPLDDLSGEAVDVRDGGCQLLSGITAIGKETGQRRIGIPAAFDEVWRAIAILDVGRTHQSVEQVVVAHPVEMVLHRRERRKVPGQLRPLSPHRRKVLDRVP
jgi:hypothetical protein